MATLQKRTFGKTGKEIYEIQFRDEHKQKKTITLPASKYTEETAFELKYHVEVLIYEKINDVGVPNRKTKRWVENAPLEIKEKLAKHGLCLMPSTRTAKELWDTYLDKHSDMYVETRKTYVYAKDRFFSFFKPGDLLVSLKKERMIEWRRFLLEHGYAPATIAGTVSKAKAVFNWAKEQHWIAESPLTGVGRGSYRNEEKDRFVTSEEYRKLLAACLDQEWRVIIALARIGGLHPCEILVLRWADIDWKNHRFRVFNAKLKQYEGKCVREVPIFEELAVELKRLRAIPGNENTEYVINRYPDRKSNLGTQFARIAKRAGITKVERPFDNMRASRSTEIHREHGAKKESVWIGHSVKVALESYLLVTDDDFAIAAGKKTIKPVDNAEAGPTPEAKPE